MGVTVHSIAAASLVFSHAAVRFACSADRLDDLAAFDAADKPTQDRISGELTDAALAAVLTSYLAIEARINELFMEFSIFPDKAHWFPGLDRGVASRLGIAWNAGAIKLNPIEKADMALVIAARSPLDWGSGSPQQFALLHSLRNDLVHHKPIRVQHGEPSAESDDRLERKLHQQFPTARIWTNKGATFRWGGCLGAGCAQWALRTSTDFVDAFASAMQIGYLK